MTWQALIAQRLGGACSHAALHTCQPARALLVPATGSQHSCISQQQRQPQAQRQPQQLQNDRQHASIANHRAHGLPHTALTAAGLAERLRTQPPQAQPQVELVAGTSHLLAYQCNAPARIVTASASGSQALHSRRGYKFYSPCIAEPIPYSIGAASPRHSKSQSVYENAKIASDATGIMADAQKEARLGEKRKERQFYLKPKVMRHRHIWKGVLRQRRLNFNYRLRWALKSMTRCAG